MQIRFIVYGIAACMTFSICVGAYKSTQDVRTDIENTYMPILQSKNIYTMSLLLDSLRSLGNRLNAYVMGKQGIAMGKKEPKSEYKKAIVLDNIFNLWEDHIFATFQKLVDTIQTLRLSPNDQNARDMLERWGEGSWKNIRDYVEKVKKNTILDSKKKLADIIMLFIDQNIKLINKASMDLNINKKGIAVRNPS